MLGQKRTLSPRWVRRGLLRGEVREVHEGLVVVLAWSSRVRIYGHAHLEVI